MKTFDCFYLELIEDERFYENASRNHRKETVEETARKVYEVETLKPEEFKVKDISEHRRHVLYKLYKVPADKIKKPWHEIKLQEEEEKRKKEEPEWIPLTGKERQKRLQEFQQMVDNSPMMKPVAPLTARERLENQDWRPKPETIKEPSELEKVAAARKHYATVRQSRALLFIEAYPDASPEEVNAYLDKFEKIDNPLGLKFDNPHDLPY